MKHLKLLNPFALASVLIPFAVYLLTLAPSVTFFDSGEFLTAIFSLGTAHSPGYPTFINYAHPFTWLPFGSIAFRVNVATAFSAAMACFGVYLLVTYLLKDEEGEGERGARLQSLLCQGGALAAALAFAFTPRLWLQSNHDKPYPLVAFISAMVIYLILLWRDGYKKDEERPGYIYLATFLCGLGFGAHQTMVLLVPPCAWLILSMNWRLVYRVKEIAIAVGFALLGFSVHLHMPIRAVRNPLLNWGDPKTLSQFLWNFLRKGYPVDPPDRDAALLWAQIKAFNVPNEFTVVGLALLIFGMFAFRKKLRDFVIAYAVAFLSFMLMIVGYFNTPGELIFLTEEFFTPLYLLSAVLIGLGLIALVRLGLQSVPEARSSKPAIACVAVMLLGLPGTLCALNYHENDQHQNYIAYDYAVNTFRSLPEGSVLFTWGDSGAFPLWYLQGVERMRDDLDILHTPHLVFPWYLDSFPHLFGNSILRRVNPEGISGESALPLSIGEFIARRPVFVDFSTRYSVPLNQYLLTQRGMVYSVTNGNPSAWPVPAPDLFVWSLYSSRGISGDEMPFRDLDTGKAILIYASAHMETGDTLMRLGAFDAGKMELNRAAATSPELKSQVQQIMNSYGGR